MREINSYSKVYNLGHRAVREIFRGPTVAQEKVDGSQFSFMRIGSEMFFRSKNKMLYSHSPEKLFKRGIEAIMDISDNLTEGYIYRTEYLQKPKHNVLKYDRVPERHCIIYDIEVKPGSYNYLSPMELADEGDRLGLETVPFWHLEVGVKLHEIVELMMQTSSLGGSPFEGIVIKNYDMFDQTTGKTLMAKHVSESFKEVHRKKSYKEEANKSVIESIIEAYKTEARWNKAVQHLREAGELEDSPTDIGKLIKEVSYDVYMEERLEIQEILFKWAWKQISRGLTRGLPEWYKQKLLALQFKED